MDEATDFKVGAHVDHSKIWL